MTTEELNKIFAKFYRVQAIAKSYSGLGMGLFICSKIINDHNGKIWVESVYGESSTFHFSIPLQRLGEI